MSAQFAMVISPVSAVRAGQSEGEVPAGHAEGLLARAAAGPGFWEEWLGELRREGLIAELLTDGVIAAAAASRRAGATDASARSRPRRKPG